MVYVAIRAVVDPGLVPQSPAEQEQAPGLGARLRGLLEIWPFFLLMVAVLGSLYGGVATPTEAVGVGAAAALLIAIGHRSLTWVALKAACLGTVRTSAMLFFIIQGVTGAALSEVVWGSLPFLVIMLGVGVVLVLFPPLAIWLPSYWIG